MAEYEARLEELERQIEEVRIKAIETERPGGAPVGREAFIRFQAALPAYGKWRDRAFNEGLTILRPETDGTPQKYHYRWIDHHLKRATDAFRTFADLKLEDPAADVLAATVASQESIAFDIIANWTFARFQGEVRERLRTLAEERTRLESKWAETISQDERQDGQIAGLRVEILETFRKGVEQVRGWGPKFEEAARTFATGWDAKEKPSPDPSFAEPTKVAIETLATLGRTLEDSVRAALPLYAAEQVVHEIFGKHREALDKLLQQLHPDGIETMYAEALSSAEASLGRVTRDGQKADLERLLKEAAAEVAPCVKEYESAFEDFVKHFRGRYTGAVSDQTIELLAEAEFFSQFWKEVEGLNLPGEIRTAGEAIARCVHIDLDRLTPEHQQQFREIVESRLRELQDRIRAMDMSLWERMKIQFWLVPRDAMRDKLKSLPGFR